MNKTLLFVTVLVIATCGLIYELIVGALASYLLGDSITQFSTVIGGYLFAMGIGSYLSRFIDKGLAQRFVEIELGVALVGGLCAPLLFLTFTLTDVFHVALYGSVLVIGTLVGLEIPLLLRILKDQVQFKDLVSQVLTFDYLGALAASVTFPLLFVPKLGLVRTSLLFGLLNALVGLWSTWLLGPVLGNPTRLRVKAVGLSLFLVVGLALGDRLTTFYEDQLYADEVVHASNSPYQRIILTRGKRGFSLFLNGNLQFASIDEYRYHESLVHPALVRAGSVERVLILGGGDGLAAREVLRYPEVKSVTLVDLDPAITGLATGYGELAALNGHALSHPKVRVINTDAMKFLAEGEGLFDAVIVDFPDPNNFSLGKLYTTGFYKLLKRRLAPEGVAVIQSTSPLFARRSFWCVNETLKAAGFWTEPYHALVPSFGEWGYVLVSHGPVPRRRALPGGLSFLDDATLALLTQFSPDMGPLPAEVNRLNNQVLVHYYEEEWSRWN
ncbi:polyamine aminopropyltransferase [Stigmatella erecta]|uniref:Polyamine aminopropyltransferase n=1 Tax=Stigmatella erecta TaxID=83460 RepID=A0A1I0I1Q8_9BACT|nr:polyamine aminopropyltransferase [Stigmatella erecta]SET90423.1 spermidine synthase [Stigmatella erecta]